MARAYIYLNRRCNQSCVFCASDETIQGQANTCDLEGFDDFLNLTSSECDSIVISGGEPTLHPKLSEIIIKASKVFRNIQLMTNGLVFADSKYLRRIISSGLTDICIPVASPVSGINDRLVGRKGAFDIQAKALSNLLSVSLARRPRVHLKTIVVTGGVESFGGFRAYLTALPAPPDFFVINGLHIGKKVLQNPALIPDYAVSGEYVSALILSLRDLQTTIAVAEFPLCLLSVDALDVLSQTGFPISATGVDSMILDNGVTSQRKGSQIKAPRCNAECIAQSFCDGLPAKNFEKIRHKVWGLLRPIVSA